MISSAPPFVARNFALCFATLAVLVGAMATEADGKAGIERKVLFYAEERDVLFICNGDDSGWSE